MIKGIRSHEDYWAEIVSGWPSDITPEKLRFLRNVFFAGFALSSSFMGELKTSSLSAEEQVAIHHFCMTECLRLSGLIGKEKLTQARGRVEEWEP